MTAIAPGSGGGRGRMLDLRTRAIKGTAWFTAARLCSKLLSWGVTLVLARWLAPADYGLFAMALAVIGFLELFQEVGLGSAIIQRQDLSRPRLNAFAWIVLGLSLAVTGAAFAMAELAAWYYREPRLVGLIRLLSGAFLLHAMAMVPYNLLTKELDFRRRSLAETCGAVFAAAVVLQLAYLGYGVWALAAGNLAGAAVRTVGVLIAGRWVPGLDVSFVGMRGVLTFGLHVTGRDAVKTLSQVVNTAIIGRLLGSGALGLYSMASSLGTGPLHQLSTSVIQQFSLPVFSKLQTDEVQLRRYFLKISKYLAVLTLPTNVGMALVSLDVITVLLSDKWAGAAGLVEVFCVGGLCYVMSLPSTSLLTARGRASRVFRTYLVSSVVVAAALLVGTRFDLAGVAIAYLATYPPLRLFLLWLGLREVGIEIRKFLENITTPLRATTLMGLAVLLVRFVLLPQGAPAERLLVCVGVGAVTYVGVVFLGDRRFGAEVRGALQTLFAPAEVRKKEA